MVDHLYFVSILCAYVIIITIILQLMNMKSWESRGLKGAYVFLQKLLKNEKLWRGTLCKF